MKGRSETGALLDTHLWPHFRDGRLRRVRGKGPALGSADYRPKLSLGLNLRMDACSVLLTCTPLAARAPENKANAPRKSQEHALSKRWETVSLALLLGS